jgi:hypothetical protein
MKTIEGGFSSKTDGAAVVAGILGLGEISEAAVDEKESMVLEELKKGSTAQDLGNSTGYGYAYTLGVQIRHKAEIEEAKAKREDDLLKSAALKAAEEEEAKIRRLVGSGDLPLSALEPYEEKEAEPIQEPTEEQLKEAERFDTVRDMMKNLTDI